MPKELPTYREELEQVIAYFGAKRILSRTDVEEYTGKSRNWVVRRVGKQTEFTQNDLAHFMASLGRK